MESLPRRLSETRRAASMLEEDVRQFIILGATSQPADVTRDDDPKDAISIKVWAGADGRDQIEICSERSIEALEVKGILFDALYALAHLQKPTSVMRNR